MDKENLSSYDSVIQSFEHLDLNKTSDPKIEIKNKLPVNKPISKNTFKCTVCDIQFGSSIDFEIHIKGRKHLAKSGLANSIPVQNLDIPRTNLKAEGLAKVAQTITCDLCKVIVSSQANIDEHMSGKKHMLKAGLASSIPVQNSDITKTRFKARVTQSQNSHSNNVIGDKYPNSTPRRQKSFGCTVCGIYLSSSIDLSIHMNGKRHFERANLNNSIPVENSNIPSTNFKEDGLTEKDKVFSF